MTGNSTHLDFAYRTKSGLALVAPAQDVKVDGSRMVISCVLTSPAKDRHGDILEPSGVVLDIFPANPVVLYNHGRNHDRAIAKSEDDAGTCTVRLQDELLLADAHFTDQQDDAFAMQIFKAYDKGIMRAWSVGFDALERKLIGKMQMEDGKEKPAYHYLKWRLGEYSATPVGVNPEALTIAVQKSAIGDEAMLPELKAMLSPYVIQPKAMIQVPEVPVAEPIITATTPAAATAQVQVTKAIEGNPEKELQQGTKPVPTDKPEPKETTTAEEKSDEGKQLKYSARHGVDRMQMLSDLLTAWPEGHDMLENKPVADHLDEIHKSLVEHHSALQDTIKHEFPEVEIGKKSELEGDKNAGDKNDVSGGTEKEADKYETRFEKSALIVKGFSYRPRRLILQGRGPAMASEETLTPEERKNLETRLAAARYKLRLMKRA